ncbi:hypothetical protein H7I53_18080 [Mycolicibacterium pulveris]|uniref:Uncharacterized protein n=1 Tax=Mycolicibacterium pulveris TaxID=36813 RepID=A0A7I7UC61_MYCPV|nr:hypothetical protein [Mycolicibacterium pulveris]MCV6982124.1 hypothetical protein [Mycolicibacterium pulveris]BBY78922.1 hypothetical protein MPUL_00800 [Mycolicibacterium pulveris]
MADVDRDAIRAEIDQLLRSGMPESVAEGFMQAKVRAIADRHGAAGWDKLRDYFDEVGAQAHQGDPVKKARVEKFNDMLIAELKARNSNG